MATRPVGTADRAAVADVHDQDHQPVILDCVQDPVITGDPDPQNPVHPREHLRARAADRPCANHHSRVRTRSGASVCLRPPSTPPAQKAHAGRTVTRLHVRVLYPAVPAQWPPYLG